MLNAANEVAVAAFLDGKIGFTRIAVLVEDALNRFAQPAPRSLDEVLCVDEEARAVAASMIETA